MADIRTKLDFQQVIKQAYDEDKERLRVDAQVSASISDITIQDPDGDTLEINPDGSLNVNILNPINVEIDAADGDNIAIHDSQGNELKVNPDGSINVNTSGSETVINVYGEASAISTGIATTLINYTLTANQNLQKVSASGTNIAMYELLVDNIVIAKQYSNFGSSLNVNFDMQSLSLINGQNIKVVVTHPRPYVGDFNSNLLLKG